MSLSATYLVIARDNVTKLSASVLWVLKKVGRVIGGERGWRTWNFIQVVRDRDFTHFLIKWRSSMQIREWSCPGWMWVRMSTWARWEESCWRCLMHGGKTLWKIPHARRGKVCSRGSRYDEESPVEEVSRTARRVLWRTPNAHREQFCWRCLMYAGNSPAQAVSGVTGKVMWKRSHAPREKLCCR